MTPPHAPRPPGRARRVFRAARLPSAAAVALLAATPLAAFDLIGRSWPDGPIPLVLSLDPNPVAPLTDGAPDFAAVAESAAQEWNVHLTRARFVVSRTTGTAPRRGNRVNDVFFASDVYGQSFGANTLAVTLTTVTPTTGRTSECDVVFNRARTWDSYRGPALPGLVDFRRVALHEFGHVLGLDHPDEAIPVQRVPAIMNSRAGDLDTLQADDIAGARALYDAFSGITPVIVAQPQSRTLRTGESYTLAVTATGSGPFTYTWSFVPAGTNAPEPFLLAEGPAYTIGSVQPVDAGRYQVAVNSPSAGFVLSQPATLTVLPVTTTPVTALANLSTRAVVGTGTGVMIAGVVVSGDRPKTLLIRAAGPALRDLGVAGALADPVLRLVDSRGATVAENDNAPADLAAVARQVGAFAFAPGSRDAALVATLRPDNYTAVVGGVANGTGIALVEVYDLDPPAAPSAPAPARLANLATRGRVDSGDNVLIAGLVVAGPGPRTYLVRAIGPTLRRDFGVADALLDPFLRIYRGEVLLRENDDWDMPAAGQPALRAAAQRVGAFALMETRDPILRTGLDAAMILTLEPGSYTAEVSGFEGRTGVALIEIYELP